MTLILPRSRLAVGCLLSAVLAVTLALVVLASPAAAAPTPVPSGAERETAIAALSEAAGIDEDEAARRLDRQGAQAALADRLEAALGERAAGTWVDPGSGALRVNVLDEAAAAEARQAGADPARVTHALADLERAQAALDPAGAPDGVTWGVDVPTNSLLVSVPADRSQAAETRAFVATARRLGVPVRLEKVAGPAAVQAFAGGEAIFGSNGGRCSAGFNTRSRSGLSYVVTAGHCTNTSPSWSTGTQAIGPTAASRFPGADYGAVRVNDPGALQPQGAVRSNGSLQPITGVGRVPVGTTVCKTGSTTGTTCGQVLRYNVTVNYASGAVRNLTETNVCSQPGDSGGPLFAGSQGQGIVSGGSVAGCSFSAFRSYYQPLDTVLSVYGLTLQ